MPGIIARRHCAVVLLMALLVLASIGLFLHSPSAERYTQSAADAIATGKAQLFERTVSGALDAYQTFQGAYASDYTSASDGQKIKIRVYLAITRMLDLLLRDDGGSVDTLTELLAQYGVTRTGDGLDRLVFTPPPMNDDEKLILPAGTPPSAETVRAFLAGPVLAALDASLADLDAAIALCPPTGEGTDREIIARALIDAEDPTQPDVEMDAGDYLLFRALLKLLRVHTLFSVTYDANPDIREVVAAVNLETGPEMINRLLDRYPDFLRIHDAEGAARLNAARLTLISAIDDYLAASERIRNDASLQPGAEELFSLEEGGYKEELLRENLAKVKTSLQANTPADLITERIGTVYAVYGGASFSTVEPDWWEKGYHPERYGYTYLGTASDTHTFSGSYNCYIIVTQPGNMAPVDAVQGSTGAYYPTDTTGSVSNWWNVGGPPDGAYALIGGDSGGESDGFIVIRPPTPIASLTVTLVNVENIAREEHFGLNLFRLFGNESTPPTHLRDLLPELNAFGYPVPGTMGIHLNASPDPTLGGILPDFTDQDQWIREDPGFFQPAGPVTIAERTIDVQDGAITDWSEGDRVFTDITGEVDDPARDIQSLYLAQDATTLYLRLDTAGAIPATNVYDGLSYHITLKKLPGDQYDRPGDTTIRVWYDGYASQWRAQLDRVDSAGNRAFVANLAATDFRVFGNHVEAQVPLARLGPLGGRYLEVDSEGFWGRWDENATCLQIQPSATVTGSLSVPGYDGVGPVRIGVFEYGPAFSTAPERRLGSQGIQPDSFGQLSATYTIPDLPVGQKVFISVLWDRDGNGIVSPGDYTSFSLPFTTVGGSNVRDLAVSDGHAKYPPPRFTAATLYHEKTSPPGSWNVSMAAQLTGPSPEDVAVTVTGPGGEFTLMPAAVINKRGLAYRLNVNWLPDGDYTFTAVDSLGRKAETVRHYAALYDLPVAESLTPANGAYTGTASPTLSWTPPATGGPYGYQVWILDYDYPNTGAIWYVSDLTTASSVTVPAGVLLPDTPYVWFVRLYDRTSNPMNYTMSPVCAFYTGAYAAAPVFSHVEMNTRPPTGTNTKYVNMVNAKVPGLAPWDVTAWRLLKGADVVTQGNASPSFEVRADDSYFRINFQTGAPPSDGNGYAFEMTVNRPGSTISRTGIPYAYEAVQAVDMVSLTPAGNAYFKTPEPTFSWSPVSDPDTYYRLRIYDPLGNILLWTSEWSTDTSVSVPAGILMPGGTYLWTVQTTPGIAPSYVQAFVNTEGNPGNKLLYRFTIQPPLPGDVSGNGEVDLEDALLALRVVSGLPAAVTPAGSADNDSRIGPPEAIYILQTISGLR